MASDVINTLLELFGPTPFAWAFMREKDIVTRDAQSGTDLDIWFEQSALDQVPKLLLQNGWHLVGGRSLGNRDSDYYNATLRFSNNDPEWPVLELFFGALRWRTVTYWKESSIPGDIDASGQFPVFSNSTLLAILLNRVVIRGALSGQRLARARDHLQNLTPRSLDRWRRATIELFGYRCTSLIEKSLLTPSRPLLSKIHLSGYLTLHSRWKFHICAAVPRIIYWNLRGHLVPGISCELVGTDGTGKSTLSDDIVQRVGTHGLDTKQIYWGRTRGNTRLVQWLRTITLSATQTKKAATPPRENEKNKRASFLYRCMTSAGALIFLAEYWTRYFTRVFPMLNAGTMVVLDRGPTDFSVMKNTLSLSRHLYKYAPPISLRLFTDAPVDEIYRRKQERSLEEIRFQQETYAKIYSRYLKNKAVMSVNTTRNRESNAAEVSAVLLSLKYVQNGALDRNLFLRVIRSFANQSTSAARH